MLPFSQAAATGSVQALASSLASGHSPNLTGQVQVPDPLSLFSHLFQVESRGTLFSKWPKLAVELVGGVVVCRVPGKQEDALPPLSLLKVHEISVQKNTYLHICGATEKPLVFYFSSAADAVPWLCALEASRVHCRQATALAMLPQDDHRSMVEWWLQRLNGLSRILEANNMSQPTARAPGQTPSVKTTRPAPVDTVQPTVPELWHPSSPMLANFKTSRPNETADSVAMR